MMAALEQVPQTFCHQDAFSRNLFSESIPKGGCFVAIDWAYAGPAPLGLDLVPLVFASMALGTIPFTEGAQLAQLALEGYQEGLAETGWKGNPDLIRFAFSVGCFWRYPFGALVGEFFEWCVNEANYAKFENLFGISIEQFADFGAVGNTWCLPYYQEALNLKKALKL